jgi:hypothetical protein
MTRNTTAPAARTALQTGNGGGTPDSPGAATGQEGTTAMTTATGARTGRRLGRVGRLAAVGALALVLAGTAAGHAEARTRQAAVRTMNAAIAICFEGGGEASVYDYSGSFGFACVYDGYATYFDVSYDE